VLRVSAPREPCFKFNAVMGYAQAARQMAQSGRCGFYLSVVQEGTIAAGQGFTLRAPPAAWASARRWRSKWARHRHRPG
jgi:MOSC domain-containing protein YiiM